MIISSFFQKDLKITIKSKDYDATSGDDDMDKLVLTVSGSATSIPRTVTMNGQIKKYSTRYVQYNRLKINELHPGPVVQN